MVSLGEIFLFSHFLRDGNTSGKKQGFRILLDIFQSVQLMFLDYTSGKIKLFYSVCKVSFV